MIFGNDSMRIAVTGAYGFSGQYIARRLLDSGHEVITLTNSPDRKNPFGKRVQLFATIFPDRQSSKNRCAMSTS
jgi:nucleoside-diphosphate-sugar epimerase